QLSAINANFRERPRVRHAGEASRGLVHSNSREQRLARLRILHMDGTDWTVLRRLHDLLNGVPRRIDRLRLTILVEAEYASRDGLAHGVADTHLGIDPNAQLAGHCLPPSAR